MTNTDHHDFSTTTLALTETQVQQFITDGYVKVEDAFTPAQAQQARSIFWNDLSSQGSMPDDPSSWTHAVIRLGMYEHPSVVATANTARLHTAFDQLVGPDNWWPCMSVGTIPVRFPSADDPGDTGWHIDLSFDYEQANFMDWRINIHSRGRALLMLMLYSDVTEDDAPSLIRVGSHRDIARVLAPAAETGMTLAELLPHIANTAHRSVVSATGQAGTVYLCHPFLVHSAQMHRGRQPRFLAQPALLARSAHGIENLHASAFPLARAITAALEENT